MRIESVLAMDSGTVTCVENNATIKVVTKGDVKTFQPSFPKGTPALSQSFFTDLYKFKHFKASTVEKPATSKGSAK